jgi:hypothetical protein
VSHFAISAQLQDSLIKTPNCRRNLCANVKPDGGIDRSMRQNTANSFIVAGTAIEMQLSGDVPKKMRMYFQSGMVQNGFRDLCSEKRRLIPLSQVDQYLGLAGRI